MTIPIALGIGMILPILAGLLLLRAQDSRRSRLSSSQGCAATASHNKRQIC
jgi:hypothetical protein